MVSLSSKNIHDIRQIVGDIGAANTTDTLRKNALQKIHRTFGSTSTIFWMIDDNNSLADPVFRGIQERYFVPYKDYFCHQNPFDPENIPQLSQPSVLMEQLEPLGNFRRTEYYNDFIKPQNIHRQMAVYIRQGDRMKAVIGLHRSSKKGFGKKGLFMGDMISRFLSDAMERLELRQMIERSKGLHRLLGQKNGPGLLILDRKLNYLFSNPAANKILKSLSTSYPVKDHKKVSPVNIPDFIISTCATMKKSDLPFYTGRSCCGPDDLYMIKWQQTGTQDIYDEKKGFVVFLEKENHDLDNRALKRQYNLTGREVEIIACLARGLTNKKIADRLFISTGTVKNHLKHIFVKTKAANRTQVVHIARSCSLF